jgi:hypothetical protein
MRSAIVSMWPNIIVQLVFMPTSWACRMTASHSSVSRPCPADLVADAIDEDLAAAAGDRVEAGLLQAQEDVAQRHVEDLVKGPDLGRAEGVNVDRRVVLFDEAEQVEVPLERQAVAGG